MKKILRVILIAMGIFIILGLIGSAYYQNAMKKPFKNINGTETIKVNAGDSLHSVIDNLGKENKISNATLAKVYLKLNKENFEIIQGAYNIKNDMTMKNFLDDLEAGNMNLDASGIIKITIPEGYNVDQIGTLLEDKGIVKKVDFIAAEESFPLPNYVVHTGKDKVRYQMEGYLFPNTYNFYKDSTAESVVKELSDTYGEVFKEIEAETGKSYTAEEWETVMIIASIVQMEIQSPDELGLAASVFYNRLKIGQKLQSCATVLYAHGVHKDKLYYKDLLIENPYNTYYNDGLPPGPITNPGKAAIKETINHPETNYYYFVSKNDGTHQWSETGEEQLDAEAIYQPGN